eukprot:gene11737-5178_t
MMPFQREGVQFGLSKGGRVLLGDEMGLGKTVQACALLNYGLRTALQQWLAVNVSDILVLYSAKKPELVSSSKAKFIIVSYDLMSDISDELKKKKLQCIVCDEVHKLKSCTSQRTVATLPLLQKARRVFLLTGTPALNRPSKLLTLMQALMPAAGIQSGEFISRYCHGSNKGARNEEELNRLLTGTVMIRRRKEDVLPQLRSKQRQKELMKTGTKFLIFAHHRVLLDGIEAAVKEAEVGYIRICGSTPPKTRSSLVDKFQESESCKVAVLGITSANTGLTLTSASIVLFAEMSWVPVDIQQAEDRVHRIGQTSSVKIQFLMVRNSIDDIMWARIQRKLNIVGK